MRTGNRPGKVKSPHPSPGQKSLEEAFHPRFVPLQKQKTSGISAGCAALGETEEKAALITDYGKDVIRLKANGRACRRKRSPRTKKHHERHAAAPEHEEIPGGPAGQTLDKKGEVRECMECEYLDPLFPGTKILKLRTKPTVENRPEDIMKAVSIKI